MPIVADNPDVSDFTERRGGTMDRRTFLSTSVVGLGAFAGSPLATLAAQTAPKLQWYLDLKAAHKVAVDQQKPLLIVFGASWCGYCHKLEKETLADRKVVQLVQREFVAVHQDFDKDDKVAEILEVKALPCTVILSPEADVISQTVGFNDVRQYLQVLNAGLQKQTQIRQAKHDSRK